MSSIPTTTGPDRVHGADDVAVARRLYDGFHARDLEAVTATLHPEVRVHQAGGLPWSGRYDGRDGAAAFLGALLSRVDPALEISDVFAAGDTVVQVGRSRGVAHGTGLRFDAAEVHVLRVRDGLVAEFTAYVDVEAFRAALAG